MDFEATSHRPPRVQGLGFRVLPGQTLSQRDRHWSLGGHSTEGEDKAKTREHMQIDTRTCARRAVRGETSSGIMQKARCLLVKRVVCRVSIHHF